MFHHVTKETQDIKCIGEKSLYLTQWYISGGLNYYP